MEQTTEGRRDFLQRIINWCIGLWTLVAITGVVYTVKQYIWPTARTAGPGEGKTSVPFADIPEGTAKKILFQGKPALVIQSDGKIYALSAVCTHLGCIVNWAPEQKILLCPCHAGKFDLMGNVLGGPPPRPLPTYQTKIVGDMVVIG